MAMRRVDDTNTERNHDATGRPIVGQSLVREPGHLGVLGRRGPVRCDDRRAGQCRIDDASRFIPSFRHDRLSQV